MNKFTPGKWWIAPPIFDGDVIYAPAQEKGRLNEVVAMGILNKADAQLIAAAPEMYRLLKELSKEYETMATVLLKQEAKELIAQIDGEEAHHD